MKKIYIILFFITLIGTASFAQSKVFVSTSAVIGYNDINVDVWKYSYKNSLALGYTIGASYQYYYKEKYFVKAGIYMQQLFANFEVNNIEARGTAYSGIIPIEIGLKFLEKYEIGAGISIKNYRDFSDFDINSSSNIRTNFIISGSYWINDKWRTELRFSRLLSSEVPSLVISSFTSHISIGINYYIF